MSKFVEAMFITCIAMITAFTAIILSSLVGGIVGWTVNIAFPFIFETINGIAKTQLTAFEIGATLGFVGSFFTSYASKKD
jgi:hypothetical protein